MVQLSILSGKQAGSQWVARRFPVSIGRSAKADLRLDDPGVWDQHLQILLKPREGYFLQAEKDALISVNGQPLESSLLRNGDSIEFGAVRIQFSLSEARQRGLLIPEWTVWFLVAIITLSQIALVCWLLQ